MPVKIVPQYASRSESAICEGCSSVSGSDDNSKDDAHVQLDRLELAIAAGAREPEREQSRRLLSGYLMQMTWVRYPVTQAVDDAHLRTHVPRGRPHKGGSCPAVTKPCLQLQPSDRASFTHAEDCWH